MVGSRESGRTTPNCRRGSVAGAGEDADNTHNGRRGPIPDHRLPTPDSRLPTADSRSYRNSGGGWGRERLIVPVASLGWSMRQPKVAPNVRRWGSALSACSIM